MRHESGETGMNQIMQNYLCCVVDGAGLYPISHGEEQNLLLSKSPLEIGWRMDWE